MLAALVLAAMTLGSTPVVVELFTSQGCSSCPPADAIIRNLARDPALRGKVIPLAFHVDYWNHLGWTDPFSSKDWSRRQMFYVRAMSVKSAYTPQAVVNGAEQFVGSRQSSMSAAITKASQQPAVGRIAVTATRTPRELVANINGEAPAGYDTILVVFENDVTTDIEGGENGGRRPTEDAIVRKLVRVAPNGSVKVPVDAAWKKLGVAVLLQNHDTLAVGNAAIAALP
jgi:hypothetical protein